MLEAYHKEEGTLTIYGTRMVGSQTQFLVYIDGEWDWINIKMFEAGDDE